MTSVASTRMFARSLVLIAILGLPLPAGAQNRLGGHFGMVFPLVNKAFPIPGSACAFFVEGVLPIRFQQNPSGAGNRTSVGLAVHVGVGF